MATGLSGRVARAFIGNKLTPILVLASLLLGLLAVLSTPREEEPQIVVPMIDVTAAWPGATAEDVERLVTVPLERALREIRGVEYVYATSRPSGALVIVRFLVNGDPERALIQVRDKASNVAVGLPPGASVVSIEPRSIDDVPIFAVTLSSGRYDALALRRIAAEIEEQARAVPDVARTRRIGGLRREVRVELDRGRLAARGLTLGAAADAVSRAGVGLPAGTVGMQGQEVWIDVGRFLGDAQDVGAVAVGTSGGRPVYLRDVARIEDGPEEPREYVFHARRKAPIESAVTIEFAKIPGANATEVARVLERRIEELRGRLVPAEVDLTVTRDYGATAAHKSNELIKHLLIATLSVVALIAVALGWRESIVVGVAVPVTLALTLLVYWLFDYTLNRVTLFALIFSIGILVDDAIVVVENIHRWLMHRSGDAREAAVAAVDEVGNPTILATFAVIAAILPMAFVSGLMGPYMMPIPVGASFAMLISLAVAFIVSPWLAYPLLRAEAEHASPARATRPDPLARIYRRIMTGVIERPKARALVLASVVVLLLGAVLLVPLRLVTVKMLPFDDKSEMQIVIDAPESFTLEATLAAARETADRLLAEEPEVRDVQIYAGTSAPFNFNGLVRHYFLRTGPSVADLQVNLLPKEERSGTSHEIAARVRPIVQEVARRHGVRSKVVEIPPGPPVLSTLVAEVYGEDDALRRTIAEQVLAIFDSQDGVVDADWYVEDPQARARFVVDRDKAALAGVDPQQIAATLRLAVDGTTPALLHGTAEREPVPVRLVLPRAERASLAALSDLALGTRNGTIVPLSEVTRLERDALAPFRYRKNGRPVTYVTGDVAGAEESPVYAILEMSERIRAIKLPAGYAVEERLVDDPTRVDRAAVVWDGEWRITYEVFRDLGIAFAAVLVLIYVLVVAWFRSFVVPLLIMAPIPLTLVGILPGHAVAGMFFTATSMIGMIALAGIIVRNSILLVDFIELSLERGLELKQAVIEAGAVRLRPIALTAAAVIVGGLVIVLDPIFQGLAVALITGVFASTALTLVVIPLLYYAVKSR